MCFPPSCPLDGHVPEPAPGARATVNTHDTSPSTDVVWQGFIDSISAFSVKPEDKRALEGFSHPSPKMHRVLFSPREHATASTV